MILDTGPLVALLHADDGDHEACLNVYEPFHGFLMTTEPVLAEAMHLLQTVAGGQHACLDFVLRGGTIIVPQSTRSLMRCQDLMAKYRDVPMDLADATLVALAEEAGIREVFTLDRRGFGAYRLAGRKAFVVIPHL